MIWPNLNDLLVWGVKAGWMILGKPVNIFFTLKGLGYTHPVEYGEPVTIYVNPDVLDQPNGQLLLQGLILHELGHHACHFSDPQYKKVHLQTNRDRLHSLLNVIMDEHLERQLRARNPAWGEFFDALASFAFKGTDLIVSLEQYAALMGYQELDAAAAALLADEAPGRITGYEHGYCLRGQKDRWVSFPEFLDLLRTDMSAWFDDGRLPEDIDKTMRQLQAQANDPQVRNTHDGLLKMLRKHRLFESPADSPYRNRHETTARISLTSLIENPPGGYTDIPSYIRSLRRALKPFLTIFPKLERFLDELDTSAGSPWFWQKRNAMLFMMRRNRDFRNAFAEAGDMTSDALEALLGCKVFDPVLILNDLVMRTEPQPDENELRPGIITLGWTQVLTSPGSSSLARFFISLRLGLGRQFVKDDPVASAALMAIPPQLRKQDMTGLHLVTEEVGRIFGEQALDEQREDAMQSSSDSRPGSSDRPDGKQPSAAVGGWLSKKISRVHTEIGSPLVDEHMTDEQRPAAKLEAEETARRIDHWLRTGTDPALEEDDQDQPSVPRGLKPKGRQVIKDNLGSLGSSAIEPGDPAYDLLNLAETLDFDPITNVVLPPARPEQYAALVQPLRRQIRNLRTYLATSGSEDVEEPAHRHGRRLDPGRLHRLAALNLPDVLFGLENRPAPDLFMGVCIDCSGSMGFEDRMPKALSFAALLLEAARGLPGVDCFALGFDDSTIYEVGRPDSKRLAGLRPGGGNNDAAGLLALARHALLSRKHRRLLVMISDGFPSVCSLDSLANLVVVLDQRYKLKSVQVAVAEMEADRVAFPRFTDLTQHDLPMSVHMFGRLVRRILQQEFGC